MDIIVDPEFERLIPPLSEQELRQLECSLLDDGTLSPLAVWAPHNILLDGHHRLRLCRQHDIPFTTTALEFDSRDAARLWIIGHQLGRRNLPLEQAAYFRGEQYQKAEKQQGSRSDLASAEVPGSDGREASQGTGKETLGHGDTKSIRDTSKRLAKEHRVSPSTIKRDAQFAEALDALAELLGVEFRSDVLAGTSSLSKKDIITLAQMPRERLNAASRDRGNLHKLAERWRKQQPATSSSTRPAPVASPPAPGPASTAAEEKVSAPVANDAQDCRDALVNILWVCGQKEETLDGLRGQLERIAAIAREVLGDNTEGIEPEATSETPLITDEDLL